MGMDARTGPRLTAFPPRAGRGRFATAWVLLFVHVLALLHLGFAPHRIDSATGHVVHVNPGAPAQAPTPGESRDDCLAFCALTQAAAMPAQVAMAGHLTPPSTPAVRSFVELPLQSRRELHRLSPSNSPPAVA